MRRRSKVAGGVAAVVLFLIGAAWFTLLGRTQTIQVADDIRVLMTTGLLGPVGANVTILTHRDATLVVDAQLAPLGKRIQRKIDALGGGPIRYLINTHWHPDHTGGNEVLRVEGEIVAHPSVRERRARVQEGFSLTKPGSYHVFAPLPETALPTRFVDRSATLMAGDIEVEVRHFGNAHTDGDLAVYVHWRVGRGKPFGPGRIGGLDRPRYPNHSWARRCDELR